MPTVERLHDLDQVDQVFFFDLDQAQPPVDVGVEHRLDQGGLAGAPGAPEQCVVGRQAAHELIRVAHHLGLLPVHAQQIIEVDPVRVPHREQAQAVAVVPPAVGVVLPVGRYRLAVQDGFPAVEQAVGTVEKTVGLSHLAQGCRRP